MKQCKRKNNIIKWQRIRQSETNKIQTTAMKNAANRMTSYKDYPLILLAINQQNHKQYTTTNQQPDLTANPTLTSIQTNA